MIGYSQIDELEFKIQRTKDLYFANVKQLQLCEILKQRIHCHRSKPKIKALFKIRH